MCPDADSPYLFQGIDAAAASIVRVLETDQPRVDPMHVVRLDASFKLAEVENAVVAFQGLTGHSTVDGSAASFVKINVAIRFA